MRKAITKQRIKCPVLREVHGAVWSRPEGVSQMRQGLSHRREVFGGEGRGGSMNEGK